jgi:hypothetical protein
MMKWLPIEKYDQLKKKPENVVFLVAEARTGRSVLKPTYCIARTMGYRTITHYFVLPDAPPQTEDSTHE